MRLPLTNRPRLTITLALLLLPWLAVPRHALAQIAPDVVVHLTISGAYHYNGTLSGPYTGIDYFCATQKDKNRPGFNIYVVEFNVTGLLNAQQKKNFSKNAFSIFIRGYKSSITRYTDQNDLDVTAIIHRHAYSGTANDFKYRMRVQMGRNGLSGSFKGSHLTAMPGFRGKPVNIQGSWKCAIVLGAHK